MVDGMTCLSAKLDAPENDDGRLVHWTKLWKPTFGAVQCSLNHLQKQNMCFIGSFRVFGSNLAHKRSKMFVSPTKMAWKGQLFIQPSQIELLSIWQHGNCFHKCWFVFSHWILVDRPCESSDCLDSFGWKSKHHSDNKVAFTMSTMCKMFRLHGLMCRLVPVLDWSVLRLV